MISVMIDCIYLRKKSGDKALFFAGKVGFGIKNGK